MYRPKDWNNPIPVIKPIPDNFTVGSAYHHHLLFEAGADAIIQALSKEGCHFEAGEWTDDSTFETEVLGTVVFIPDMEDKDGRKEFPE